MKCPTHTLLASESLAPLPVHPCLFSDTQAMSDRGESERLPIPLVSGPESDTYVPTHGRQVVVAPNTPPPSPSAVELVGPLSPVLRWGKRVYKVDGLIAAGSYGRVAMATTTGPDPPKPFAIKVYCKDTLIADPYLAEMYNLEREIMLEITKRDYQWLVGLRGAFGDFWNKYLVMCTPLSSRVVRQLVEELTLAMCDLYDYRVVHCDLKPSNILFSEDGHLAIADFGIALTPEPGTDANKPFEECTVFGHGGTHAYQPPEILISNDRVDFTCAADMWALGAIIYEIYAGERLFSSDINEVRNEVWAWDIPDMVHKKIDNKLLQDLIIKLLEVDPEKRLKLKDLLQHWYFEKTDWKVVRRKGCPGMQ
ncbi:kinase-like domain-containing protein [Russula dissimulans]|nr:kinase-like domain-containing protein [Russula dissimulans]